MNPDQALVLILDTAKNAVLVARPGGQMTGLTFQDHANMHEAEHVLRLALSANGDTHGKEKQNVEQPTRARKQSPWTTPGTGQEVPGL